MCWFRELGKMFFLCIFLLFLPFLLLELMAKMMTIFFFHYLFFLAAIKFAFLFLFLAFTKDMLVLVVPLTDMRHHDFFPFCCYLLFTVYVVFLCLQLCSINNDLCAGREAESYHSLFLRVKSAVVLLLPGTTYLCGGSQLHMHWMHCAVYPSLHAVLTVISPQKRVKWRFKQWFFVVSIGMLFHFHWRQYRYVRWFKFGCIKNNSKLSCSNYLYITDNVRQEEGLFWNSPTGGGEWFFPVGKPYGTHTGCPSNVRYL